LVNPTTDLSIIYFFFDRYRWCGGRFLATLWQRLLLTLSDSDSNNEEVEEVVEVEAVAVLLIGECVGTLKPTLSSP
jgi:hypothetical protein